MLNPNSLTLRPGLYEFAGAQGCGKTEFTIEYLRARTTEAPSTRIAWIEEYFSAYPIALAQKGIELSKILFVEAQKDFVWAALQAIRSGLFRFIALVAASLPEIDLRRMQLSCERTGTSLILLSEEPTKRAWPIQVQLLFENQTTIHVLKDRSQKLWNYNGNEAFLNFIQK